MRARNIKPGFFKNEVLGTADPLLSILFAGLWCLADRDGKLEDRPLRIKAEILPYREDTDIHRYLTELSRLGFIQRYEVDGKGYIFIPEFTTHQRPHHTEKKSTFPDIPDRCDLTVNEPLRHGGNPPDLLIPDLLIPDSLIADSLIADSPEEAAATKAENLTQQQRRIFDCCQNLKAKILSRFPHVVEVFDTEVDKCVAFYCQKNIGADPALVIWKWFERVKKPEEFVDFIALYGGQK